MKNLIKNIIANSQDSKMLRRDIFRYFIIDPNHEIRRSQISRAIEKLTLDGVIISKLVSGTNYDATEYSLSEEYKETMLHI